MAKYRKKPVVIDAWQWPREKDEMPDGAVQFNSEGMPYVTTTHDGQTVRLLDGDWVIPEPDGEHYYPCKPDIFEATYEKVEEITRKEMKDGVRYCCHIGCQAPAEWEVFGGPGDSTDACTKHVGDLLTDAQEHRIFCIRVQADEKVEE